MDATRDSDANRPGGGVEDAAAELRFYEQGDERQLLEVLRACHGDGWGDEALWRWKHCDRPGFVPEDVMVATVQGRTVGCFHFSVLALKLEEELEVPVSLDGDFAVVPEFRKLGIPIAVIDRSDPAQRARGAVLRGGFTSEALNDRFYSKQFGQVFVPAVTTQYRKVLGPGPLMPRVRRLGEELLASARLSRTLGRWPTTVDLLIPDFPACHVRLDGDAFELGRGTAPEAHLRVSMPYSLLARLADGPGACVREAARLFVRGRLRIGGLGRQMPRLIRMGVSLLLSR